jgi:hypothetical protein
MDKSFIRRVRERSNKVPKGIASKVGAKNTREAVFVLVLGLMLSLNSGYINGLCLSGMVGPDQQGVSAFTATYTKSGLALAAGDPKLFGFEFTLILSFIGGAFVSGAMNPDAVPHELVPSYGPSKFYLRILLQLNIFSLMVCISLMYDGSHFLRSIFDWIDVYDSLSHIWGDPS